jgi:hypothetical protein
MLKDWRGGLVNAVASVFREEQNNLVAELRSFVMTNSYLDENKVKFFESKINKQVSETSKL